MILSYALTGRRRVYLPNFDQAPGCINLLDVGEQGWIVRVVNYAPLEPILESRTTSLEDFLASADPRSRS
jgi:probable phosphoglycerate mutase